MGRLSLVGLCCSTISSKEVPWPGGIDTVLVAGLKIGNVDVTVPDPNAHGWDARVIVNPEL